MNIDEILSTFAKLEPEPSWSFAGTTTAQTGYITHNYHHYPAKFIPQLAARLICEYSEVGDLVVDPFMGSGTTLVEARIHGRPSVGVDINPVAHLITMAKISLSEPNYLDSVVAQIESRLASNHTGQLMLFDDSRAHEYALNHERIDYWFKAETKRALAKIYVLLDEIQDVNVRTFLRCGFSNILKNCSIWAQKSTKPTRDFSKKIPDPIPIFLRQIKQMAKRNRIFYQLLEKSGYLGVYTSAYCEDARNLPAKSDTVQLVVTSPPYVTSYEYADLHQLTALWFGYTTDLSEFRRRFIGTAHHEEKPMNLRSEIAEGIVADLNKKNPKTACEVATYFTEMLETFLEMQRVLKKGGYACIVIGDTTLEKVDIKNAEVFVEQMQNIGFSIERLIMREIPSKILPQTRDKTTGRFTKSSDADFLAYPCEYILVMRKD
ncbi:site-specific DNA-methyltransferase [Candidatus Poribacteria bacterium]|nr:site-specific DNA-methyltransferase [Candidatus Poribacteria bacterium]